MQASLRRQRSGNNAVEFALIMPVFILLVFGMMEYGWAFFMRTGVINSVRAGCRTAVVTHPDDDPAAVAEEAIEQHLDVVHFAPVQVNEQRTMRGEHAAGLDQPRLQEVQVVIELVVVGH